MRREYIERMSGVGSPIDCDLCEDVGIAAPVPSPAEYMLMEDGKAFGFVCNFHARKWLDMEMDTRNV